MKIFDNKRLLAFIIIVCAILTVAFVFTSCKNYFKSSEYNYKYLAEKEYADKHKLSYSDAELMKSIQLEINEINKKSEELCSVDSQTQASIKVLVEKLCDTLSYNAKTFKGSKVKALLSEYFTRDCLTNIDEQFVFSDHEAYRIQREVETIMLSRSGATINGLIIADYTDRNSSGKEYMDCRFYYDKSTNAYYISDINVIKG